MTIVGKWRQFTEHLFNVTLSNYSRGSFRQGKPPIYSSDARKLVECRDYLGTRTTPFKKEIQI